MKKLVLNLDALRVESFEASPTSVAERGTVRGNDSAATDPTHPEARICIVDHSGEPCVVIPATPASLCGWDCVWETSDCG
jgi:hypothetical protein